MRHSWLPRRFRHSAARRRAVGGRYKHHQQLSCGQHLYVNPGGPNGGRGRSDQRHDLGTSYTVTSTSGGCTSAASASFSNAAQLPPGGSDTQQHAAKLFWRTVPAPSAITWQATPIRSPLRSERWAQEEDQRNDLGTSYTVTSTSGGCTSAASASFSNRPSWPTPAVPTLSSTPASCSGGRTSTISNYLAGNTYTFTPAGPTVGAGGLISGMTLGTSYTVTSTAGL